LTWAKWRQYRAYVDMRLGLKTGDDFDGGEYG
jgi:hypothetical protein